MTACSTARQLINVRKRSTGGGVAGGVVPSRLPSDEIVSVSGPSEWSGDPGGTGGPGGSSEVSDESVSVEELSDS